MLPPRFRSRFLELFFRYFWLNVLPVVMMLFAALIFLREPVYLSRASLYVQSDNLLDTLTRVSFINQPYVSVDVASPAQLVVGELRELLQTDAFIFAVINESDLRDQLRGSTREVREVLQLYREALVITVEGDKLVRLEVEADTPELAFQFASGTLNAYRSWKISKDMQDGQIAQSFFDEITISYRQELEDAWDDLRFYLQQYPEPAVGARPVEESIQIQELQLAVTVAEERMTDVLSKAESARLALAQTERDVDQTYRVVDPPVVPTSAEPMLYRFLLALTFPALGLVLSVVIVLGRCVSDRTVLNRLDVTEEFELPVLAMLTSQPVPSSHSGRNSRPAPTTQSDEPVGGPAHA